MLEKLGDHISTSTEPVIARHISGFSALAKKENTQKTEMPDCMIHGKAFSFEAVGTKFEAVMNDTIKLANDVKWQALNTQLFRDLREEMWIWRPLFFHGKKNQVPFK